MCLGPGTEIQGTWSLFCQKIGAPICLPICWDFFADFGGGGGLNLRVPLSAPLWEAVASGSSMAACVKHQAACCYHTIYWKSGPATGKGCRWIPRVAAGCRPPSNHPTHPRHIGEFVFAVLMF